MRGRKRRTQLLELQHIYLPPELWREILARLPPKTLLQFRCVCKDWCSLIDDSDFISMHSNLYRNYHAKTQLLTIEMARGASLNYTFALRRSDTFRKIAQLFEYPDSFVSCETCLVHGLLLLSSNSDYLTLLNPSIRKSLTLPRCPLRLSDSLGSSSFLGYAHSHNDYKVVAFACVHSKAFVLAIAIYSLRDHLWRENRIQVPEWCYEILHWGRAGNGAIYFQGAVYWRPIQGRTRVDTKLLSFDFDSEELRYMKLPDIEEGMLMFLFLFGGSLAVFGISSVRSCIWVLETNAGNQQWRQYWNRDTSLDAYELFQDCSRVSSQILYIEDTGTLLVKSSRKLMAYNIISNQTQCLAKVIPFKYMDTYVESLVLHKGYEGAVLTSGA